MSGYKSLYKTEKCLLYYSCKALNCVVNVSVIDTKEWDPDQKHEMDDQSYES